MKITGINPYNNLSYKGIGAQAQRRQIIVKPVIAYESSDTKKLNSAYNSEYQLPRLPQISSKAKSYHSEGARLFKDMQRTKEQAEARIGLGEDQLFDDYALGSTNVSFDFNTKSNNMEMFERDFRGNLLRLSVFDSKGNMEITQFSPDRSITATLHKGEIEKIALNQTLNEDGSIEADRVYKYSNGSVVEAQIGYKKDSENQKSLDELYDFKKLYQGRWDYNQGYQEHENELTDDEYITYNKRLAISTNEKVIAYAEDYLDGHHDGKFKTTVKKIVKRPEYQERFEKSDWIVKQTA